MDRRNNFFYDPQYENHSQDYFPSLENIPKSDEFSEFDNMNSQFSQNPTHSPNPEYHQTFENISEDAPQNVQQTYTNSSIWSDQEDIALMSGWCFVSSNPIVSNNQNSSSFWTKVLNIYEQARAENPNIGGSRTAESLRQRFRRLNKNVTLWIAVYKKAYERRTSGQSMEDVEKIAQTMYGKSKFTHHEVFEKVMRHYPNWELKLNSTGYTRSRPDDDDSVDESHGSSKKSRTDEDGDPPPASTPETPGSDASLFSRPIGRDKVKAKAKKKGKEAASQSSILPDDFTTELRELRITRAKEVLTREKELDLQKEKMKNSMLMFLMGKGQLTPEEEDLKRRLMAELYGM